MKKYLKFACLALIASIILPFTACKDDDDGTEKRPDCDIVEFSIPSLDLVGVVDPTARTVTLTVAPDYNDDLLKDVAPSIKISAAAKISPEATVKQNFTVDVQYTVTAENGDKKEWTVKLERSPYVSIGIGQVNAGWQKTAEELGLSANSEATIATSGDLIVCGRSGLLIDGVNGTPKTEKLNMTGIECHSNDAYNIAFTVANDDAGNLIGCTLGAWGEVVDGVKNPFKVYKWTSESTNPVELISHPQTATSHFGRKLTAVGDVNGKAIVTSYDCANENTNKPGTDNPGPANHTYWTITSGTAAAGQKVSTKYNTGTYQQMLWPVSADAISPFYFSDPGAANADPISTIKYVDASSVETTLPKGPVPDSEIVQAGEEMFKQLGWGRKVLYTQLFNFNDKKYMAVLSYYDNSTINFNYYITILDLQDNYKVVFYDKKTYTGGFAGINVNGTAGLAVSKVTESDETKTMRLYALFTSTGIASYEISNLAKTQ